MNNRSTCVKKELEKYHVDLHLESVDDSVSWQFYKFTSQRPVGSWVLLVYIIKVVCMIVLSPLLFKIF